MQCLERKEINMFLRRKSKNMIHKIINLRENHNPNPTLTTYVLNDPIQAGNKRPAVLVCPGGGYRFCSPRESEPVAMQYNAAGFHAFVLNYSVAPNKYPNALEEVSMAIKLIRENAEEWGVEKDHIAVIGFSAGGHLAGSIGMFWNQEPVKVEDKSNQPNAIILSYPVITSGEKAHRDSFLKLCGEDKELEERMSLENQVSEDTPPMFIWHTVADTLVPVENSLLLANALQKKKIPYELHIFTNGDHGISIGNSDVGVDVRAISINVPKWVEMSANWLKELFGKR